MIIISMHNFTANLPKGTIIEYAEYRNRRLVKSKFKLKEEIAVTVDRDFYLNLDLLEEEYLREYSVGNVVTFNYQAARVTGIVLEIDKHNQPTKVEIRQTPLGELKTPIAVDTSATIFVE